MGLWAGRGEKMAFRKAGGPWEKAQEARWHVTTLSERGVDFSPARRRPSSVDEDPRKGLMATELHLGDQSLGG